MSKSIRLILGLTAIFSGAAVLYSLAQDTGGTTPPSAQPGTTPPTPRPSISVPGAIFQGQSAITPAPGAVFQGSPAIPFQPFPGDVPPNLLASLTEVQQAINSLDAVFMQRLQALEREFRLSRDATAAADVPNLRAQFAAREGQLISEFTVRREQFFARENELAVQ